MKTIIAGSRSIRDQVIVDRAVEASGFCISTVVSGCALGVDILGEKWAKAHTVTIMRFPADWSRFGRSAGVLRNQQMANYADALIAVWDGTSRGTRDMITRAKARGLKVFVYRWPPENEQLTFLPDLANCPRRT